MRLVCNNFAATASPYLFRELSITFRTNTFRGPGRMKTLERIGRHVKRLKLCAPHSGDAFLPPLLDPMTGEQLTFNYVPQIDHTSRTKEPKYGTWEMTDVLIRQYPPLFHAATNIPIFIRALTYMSGVEHITINCPDQNMSPRYRRSISDYTLVSLRIAIERAPLYLLSSLKLRAIHPSALLYLQPILSYGSTPNSCRRWSQIRQLSIDMEPTPFHLGYADEHLRVVQSYLRSFATTLTHLAFRWLGSSRGPSPLTSVSKFGPQIPQPHGPPPSPGSGDDDTIPIRPLRFFHLQYLLLENALMDSEQVSSFITHHRHSLREFCFEDVALRNGDWQSTLEPLRKLSRKRQAPGKQDCPRPQYIDAPNEDSMDVPCMLSPVEIPAEPIIMETLAPQDDAEPWGTGAASHSTRPFRTGWLDRKVPKIKAEMKEKWSGHHWRKVLQNLAWR
jgi:hypothetical protein